MLMLLVPPPAPGRRAPCSSSPPVMSSPSPLVLTARSEMLQKGDVDPTDIFFVPTKPPPPPPPPTAPSRRRAIRSARRSTPRRRSSPRPPRLAEPIADGPPITSIDPVIGNAVEPLPAAAADRSAAGDRPHRGALRHPRRRGPPALPRVQAARSSEEAQPPPRARHRRARAGDLGRSRSAAPTRLPRCGAAPHPAPLALPAGDRGERGGRRRPTAITLKLRA